MLVAQIITKITNKQYVGCPNTKRIAWNRPWGVPTRLGVMTSVSGKWESSGGGNEEGKRREESIEEEKYRTVSQISPGTRRSALTLSDVC